MARTSATYERWQDVYRERWRWDGVYWGTHCVNCYPGNCPFRVYVRDGIVWREEQAGTLPVVQPGVPDMNPMGCQKGASWSTSLYGPDRLLSPLKRIGARGEGRWNRVSWDEALTGIADAIIDAVEAHGPRAIVQEGSPQTSANPPSSRFMGVLGGQVLDLNGSINDFAIGLHETFGGFSATPSVDDWFHSELLLMWHGNPVYTRIPYYHYMAEARYRGAEVVNISPDVNPSHMHADYQVPVHGASDAALALALVQVMLSEGLADERFIREQTDLAMLVRTDSGRYLREPDVTGGGRDDQLYHWDPKSGLRPADRGQLLLGDVEVALGGSFEVRLHDGAEVRVRPALDILRERLDTGYTPEAQQAVTGVHPDVVRMLARKIATRRTAIVLGINSCKFYHGDLMERAMSLVLAVSGNWGRHGTGPRSWGAGLHDGQGIATAKPGAGAQHTEAALVAREAGIRAMRQADPTLSDELAVREGARQRFAAVGAPAPAFWWYWQTGHRDRWNRQEWGDPTLARTFDEYVQEALDRGWWNGPARPQPDDEPRVLIECGGNMLRRTRGGKRALLEHLWPKLDLVVSIDTRINQTGLYADYVLPAAQQYEKIGVSLGTPDILNLTLSDRAVEPAGEAREEWDLFSALLAKIGERATARGLVDYPAGAGEPRTYQELAFRYTPHDHLRDRERLLDEQVRDSALAGTVAPGTTLETMRERGHVRFTDWGLAPMAISQASPLLSDETHVPFRDHVERGTPYPTYARRAQFYIDHEWFLEAGEELPVHKPNPVMGGNYPLRISSGHSRWSIHSMNHANRVILGTHRGEPDVVLNPRDAADRGIADGDLVRVFNEVGEFRARAKIAPGTRPGQLISYNGWEGFQYPGWSGANEIEPGMVKWIGFAGGYGQLRYAPMEWQPVPVDRWVACEVERA